MCRVAVVGVMQTWARGSIVGEPSVDAWRAGLRPGRGELVGLVAHRRFSRVHHVPESALEVVGPKDDVNTRRRTRENEAVERSRERHNISREPCTGGPGTQQRLHR